MLLKQHLLLFAKYPTPGRVKTRLAVQIGEERAAAYYKEMVESIVRAVMPQDDSFTLTCCFDPPEQVDAFRKWIPEIQRFAPQCPGNLGVRMVDALETALSSDADKAIIIGSDCVDLTRELLLKAFDSLETHDVVLGPAEDGGYYLIGMKRLYPKLFQDIHWSTERVLEQTLDRGREIGLDITILPILRDIDFFKECPSEKSAEDRPTST